MAKKLPKGDELMMSVNFNKKLAKRAQDSIDAIYKNTFYTDNKDKQYIENNRDKMDKIINSLIDKTKLRTGDTNVSALYARTLAKGDQSLSIMKDVTDQAMISDILDLYSNNMVIKDMDREIDVVTKYVPRLDKALLLIQNAVLASDHMNENDIEINVINTSNQDRREKTSDSSDDDKVKICEKKYNWTKLKKDIYQKTSKYGEQFIYVIPYKKAMARLLNQSNNRVSESGILTESAINEIIAEKSTTMDLVYSLNEDASVYDQSMISMEEQKTINESKDSFDNFQVEINKSGVIPSVVAQGNTLRRVLGETSSLIQEATVKSDYGLAKNSLFLKGIDKDLKKFVKGSLDTPSALSADGFIDPNSKMNANLDVPGCIIEILKHEYVKPLYISHTCLGYYYIECDRPMDTDAQTTFSSTLGGMRPKRSTRDRENMDRSNMDVAVLQKIAKQISAKIDAKFINANQDLAEEIYTILKYNADHGDGKIQKIRISFIPPEDMVHSYFNFNDKTHRGISDLEKSLFPAKLFSCLYISNSIALLTRGFDKRVYHVKQTVDTNITAVLLNVINQIKQSNFNLRQIENMNNIMNITGRFNDMVIPQNNNGESPVNMEVLPGQNIDVKSEFMNSLEEVAVELTGVSMEMIAQHFQNEQSATNVVQNNERFLIQIYDRQVLYSEILTALFSKIYQAENNTDDMLQVKLPAPSMLKLANTSQLLATGNDVIQNIIQMQMASDPREDMKLKYTEKLMQYYYGTVLPMEELNKLKEEAEIELMADKDASPSMGDMQQQQ